MKNSKLVKVLSSFSNIEMKHLGQMVRSPYFNTKDEVSGLFEILRSAHPEFRPESVDKESVFEKLFPEAEFNSQLLRDTARQLVKLCERLLMDLPKNQGYTDHLRLIYGYSDRGLYKEALKEIERSSNKLSKDVSGDSHLYYVLGWIKNEENFVSQRMNQGFEPKTYHSDFIADALKLKEASLIIDACNSYQVLFNNRSIYGRAFDEQPFKDILLPHQKSIDNFPFGVRMKFQLFKMLLTDEFSDFQLLKSDFFNNLDKLAHYSKRNYLANLENYCKRKIVQGSDDFLEEEFNLYQLEIENDLIIFYNDQVDNRHFLSMVQCAMELGKTEWVKKLISSFKDRLIPEAKESLLAFSNALIHFHEGDHRKALRTLSASEYTTYYQKLETRILRLRIYFEMDAFDQLDSLMDSTRHFVAQTEHLPEERRQQTLNFVSILGRLSKQRSDHSESVPENLISQINTTTPLIHRSWLIGKCNKK